MISFLTEYFKWNQIIGVLVLLVYCFYDDMKNLLDMPSIKEIAEEVRKEYGDDAVRLTLNPNFVPPATAKRFEIKLSYEPYLDSIQAYSMDDLGCCIERYEHIYSDGNTVYLPFQARKARAICVQYAYQKGDLIFPIYEIIRR